MFTRYQGFDPSPSSNRLNGPRHLEVAEYSTWVQAAQKAPWGSRGRSQGILYTFFWGGETCHQPEMGDFWNHIITLYIIYNYIIYIYTTVTVYYIYIYIWIPVGGVFGRAIALDHRKNLLPTCSPQLASATRWISWQDQSLKKRGDPQLLNGWFHGKIRNDMDDQWWSMGYPHFSKPPYGAV